MPKVADASQVLRWGTTIFRYCEATGFVSFLMGAGNAGVAVSGSVLCALCRYEM